MKLFDELQARYRSNPFREEGKRFSLVSGSPSTIYDLIRMHKQDYQFQSALDRSLKDALKESRSEKVIYQHSKSHRKANGSVIEWSEHKTPTCDLHGCKAWRVQDEAQPNEGDSE